MADPDREAMRAQLFGSVEPSAPSSDREATRVNLFGAPSQPEDREKVRESLFRPAADIESEAAARDMEGALKELPFSDDTKFYKAIGRMKDPTQIQKAMERAKAPLAAREAIRSAAGERAASEIARGRKESGQRVIKSLTDSFSDRQARFDEGLEGAQQEDRKNATLPLRLAGIGGMKAIDTPFRAVRMGTEAAFGSRSVGDIWDKPLSGEDWAKKVFKTAETDPGWRGTLAGLPAGAAATIGEPIGAAIGTLPAGMGALTDVPGMVRGEHGTEDVLNNMKETVKGGAESGSHLALQFLADPLSMFGGGLAGQSKNAVRSVLGARASLGMDAKAASMLAEEVGAIMSKSGGTALAPMEIQAAFSRAGAPAGAAEKIWGKDLQMLGRGQAEIHPPFMSGMSVPIDTQYRARKAISSVVDPYLTSRGGRGLFDPTIEFAKNAQRSARGAANVYHQEDIANLGEQLGPLGQQNPNLRDPKKLEEMYTRAIEPDFTRGPAPAPESGPIDIFSPMPAQTSPYAAVLEGANGERQMLTPAADYVPFEKANETWGPGSQEMLAALREHSEGWQKSLSNVGYLSPEQTAANPISGMYMRRQTTPIRGSLETSFDAARKTSGQGGNLRAGRVGEAENLPGGLSRSEMASRGRMEIKEKNPLEIASSYSQQASRAQAETELHQTIAEQFGKPIGPGNPLLPGHEKLIAKLPDGKTLERQVPSDVLNVMSETFAPRVDSLGKLARASGIKGSNPASQNFLRAIDGVDMLNGRWKGLVLKSPGYNVVNLTNDMMWMITDGNKQAPRFFALAHDALTNPSSKVKIGSLDTTASEIAREAAMNGIPLKGGASNRFDLDPAKSAADELRRSMEPAGLSVKKVARAIAPAELGGSKMMQGVSEGIEARSKFAHYLWRRSMGDSPAEAARRTMEVLIDYGSRTRAEQLAGIAVPFAKFMMAAPGRTARMAVKNPAALSAVNRGLEQIDDETKDVPDYMRERGRPVVLGGSKLGDQLARTGRTASKELANASEALRWGPSDPKPAQGIPEDMSVGFNPRIDAAESFAPWMELAGGNPDPMMMSTQPLVKMGAEMALGRDLARKQDFPQGTSALGMFPAGGVMAGAFPSLAAEEGGNPWLARALPPFAMGRGELMLGNQITNMNQPGGDFAQWGSMRPYIGSQDPRDINGLQILPYLFGSSLYGIGPEVDLANDMRKAKVRAAAAGANSSKKADKDEIRGKTR